MKNLETWVATFTGKKLKPFDPSQAEIDIKDIAHSLSMMCRFNGHCSRFYSVAEHSILLSTLVSKPAAFYGLMHDAAEAYLSDIPKPIKMRLPDAINIEDTIMKQICEKFNIPVNDDIITEVKEADLRMLETERIALIHKSLKFECTQGIEPYWNLIKIIKDTFLSSQMLSIEKLFLGKFGELYERN
jgi:hypothetical protein